MGIGRRIKDAREKLKLTQRELAARTGVTAAAIANYENEVSQPRGEVLYALFNALNVDANYIFQDHFSAAPSHGMVLSAAELNGIRKYRRLDEDGKDMVKTVLDKEFARASRAEMQKASYSGPIVHLPFYQDKVSAGLGNFVSNGTTEQLSIKLLPETRGADYVVQVTGNSMEPTYHDGDLVLVHSQSEIAIGEIGLWILNGDGYIKERGKDALVSRNPQYSPIMIEPNDRVDCFGKVLRRLEKEWIVENA